MKRREFIFGRELVCDSVALGEEKRIPVSKRLGVEVVGLMLVRQARSARSACV
jgi:hypothetical protein